MSYNRGQSQFNNYVNLAQERGNTYQSFTKNYVSQQQREDSNPDQNATRQIEGPKPKLMITAGPANGSGSAAKQPYLIYTPKNKHLYPIYRLKPANLFRADNGQLRQGQWSNCAGRNQNWRQQETQRNYFTELEPGGEQQKDDAVDDNSLAQEEPPSEQPNDYQKGRYENEEFRYHVITMLATRARPSKCRNCMAAFPSNNKLHKHLRTCPAIESLRSQLLTRLCIAHLCSN